MPPFTKEQEARMRQIFRDEIAAARLNGGIVDLPDGFLLSDRYVFDKLIQVRDGRGFQFGRSTGTKIGTGADQKLSFFGATPVIQPATPVATAAAIISLLQSLGLSA